MMLCVLVLDVDPMKYATQWQVYVRHWHPSTFTVDKTREVILDQNTTQHLKERLAELSGISPGRIQFAKVTRHYACLTTMILLIGFGVFSL